MNIKASTGFKRLIFSVIVMLAGIIITIVVTELMLFSTRDVRKKLTPVEGNVNVASLPDSPFIIPEAPKSNAAATQGNPEGFLPPVDKNAPTPSNSKKANNSLDNLLFAMSFYYRVPAEQEMDTSVVGWDPDSGYYLPDKISPIMTLTRNVRYLLVLKIYQKLYPTTRYFDNDAVRIESIVRRQLSNENLDSLLSAQSNAVRYLPEKLFFDLLDLSKITGDDAFRKAALKVGQRQSARVVYQAGVIKSNRDRTDSVGMFGDAAVGYVTSTEMGKLDLIEDSKLLVDELMKQLWAENFNLFYTNVAIGQLGNITETFITTDQMHALANLARFANASGDKELAEKAHKILTSLADGTNVLCDIKRFGFFRRYNGKSMSPHEDFKLAEDHIIYLEAWIRLNMLMDGAYEKVLSTEYEGYGMFLYDDYNNGIYLSYEMNWKPHPEENGKPIISVDAILDYLLITLQDRKFVADKAGS